jgi:hypothetical protein
MGVLAEIVQAMHADSEPVITYENIHDSALKLTKANVPLRTLMTDRCQKVVDAASGGRHLQLGELLYVRGQGIIHPLYKYARALGQ